MSFIEAIVQLPYSKPGNDLKNCLVENDGGCVDVKQTLQNMIDLLKTSINQLEELQKNIPNDNTLDIYGSGSTIGMSGDNEVLDMLLDKGLVFEGTFDEESDYNDDDDDVVKYDELVNESDASDDEILINDSGE
jgi:hypothetical protein